MCNGNQITFLEIRIIYVVVFKWLLTKISIFILFFIYLFTFKCILLYNTPVSLYVLNSSEDCWIQVKIVCVPIFRVHELVLLYVEFSCTYLFHYFSQFICYLAIVFIFLREVVKSHWIRFMIIQLGTNCTYLYSQSCTRYKEIRFFYFSWSHLYFLLCLWCELTINFI